MQQQVLEQTTQRRSDRSVRALPPLSETENGGPSPSGRRDATFAEAKPASAVTLAQPPDVEP